MVICVVLDDFKRTEIIFKITYITPQFRIANLLFILGVVLIMLPFTSVAQNQTDSVSTGSVPDFTADSLASPPDSVDFVNATDSIPVESAENNSVISSKIEYSASDSIDNDVVNKKVFLYGNAVIKYQDIVLKAAVIEYDFQNYTVHAFGVQDTAGAWMGEPDFKQGSSAFRAHEMKYNFRSKKAYVRQVETEVIEGTLTGSEVKTTDNNNVIYVRHGEYCPCEDPNAKTRFKIGKLKVIKDEQIVTGPGYMVIGKVPTPLAFPFGFFPNTEDKQAGLIFPSYGNGGDRGYFLNDLGFYIPIGDRWDTKFLADIYTRGSWGLANMSNYKRRYKYAGRFSVEFNKDVIGDRDLGTYDSKNSFFVRWNHQQDIKARPNSNFQANVNAGSTQAFRNNLNSSQEDYLTNTFNSSITYDQRFYNSPWSYTLKAGHSQNSQTKIYEFTLPQFSLNRARTMPLDGLFNDNPKQEFYEKLSLTYNSEFSNYLKTTEAELSLDNLNNLKTQFRNGMQHNISLALPLNAGPISISPGFKYTEKWYLQTYGRSYDPDLNAYVTDTISGFDRNGYYNFNVSATTKLYGMYSFRSGRVRAIRHTVTPNVSYSMAPDFGQRIYGFYGDNGRLSSYTPYDGTIYGGPPSGRSEKLNFSIGNNLEAKVLAPRDTTSKYHKVALIENFSVSSGYNFAKDSMNFDPIRMSLRTKITKYINFQSGASFEPYTYVLSEDDRIVSTNTYLVRSTGRLMSFESGNLSVDGTGFGSEMFQRRGNKGSAIIEAGTDSLPDGTGPLITDAGTKFTIPWHFRFGYTLQANRGRAVLPYDEGKMLVDSIKVTHSARFSGDFTLFKKVFVSFESGYDFVAKELTPTTFYVRVDLNCWELSGRIIPFGDRKSYSVSLNIKSSMLKDLKLEKKGNFNPDSNYFF